MRKKGPFNRSWGFKGTLADLIKIKKLLDIKENNEWSEDDAHRV